MQLAPLPAQTAEALVLPACLLSGSQTVWKPIGCFIKLTFTLKMKVKLQEQVFV